MSKFNKQFLQQQIAKGNIAEVARHRGNSDGHLEMPVVCVSN